MFTNRVSSRTSALHPAGRFLQAWLIALATLLTSGAAAAERLAASDRQAIETTIRQQLAAFTRDDAKTAFGYAAPDVRRKFGTSDDFLSMVRESYAPVYRSADVQFVRLDLVDGRWVQSVQLVDGEGRVWRALFTMRRQADRAWKVGGCQIVQTAALAT